jgi:hypothetical protein
LPSAASRRVEHNDEIGDAVMKPFVAMHGAPTLT